MIEAHAERSGWNRNVSLWFTETRRDEQGRMARYFAKPAEYDVWLEPGESAPPQTVLLGNDAAQQLMDELWRVGFRPTEGSGSAGSLAATERHLADMRRLVFDPQAALDRAKENT